MRAPQPRDARGRFVAREPEQWTVGQWAGRPRYRCCGCAYDTLDIELMRAHVRAARHT